MEASVLHAPGSRAARVVARLRPAVPRARDRHRRPAPAPLRGLPRRRSPSEVSTRRRSPPTSTRSATGCRRTAASRSGSSGSSRRSSASATCARRRSSRATARDFSPDRAYAWTQVSLRIIPLGGLGEVGKNMTVYESGGEAIVVDAGLAFPRDEHLGVDLVLPEMTYLAERPGGVRAVVLTHGHEDHVGALPYLLRVAKVKEIWATRLTLGLIKSKLDEHGLLRAAEMREAEIGVPVELGPFRIEFVRMAHSIPGLGRARDRGGGKADRAHGRLQARPHADRRAEDRRRPARRARQPRRRPPARRLHERRAPGCHAVGAGRRRGVPADLPAANGSHPRLVVRLERPPCAAGDRRRRRRRPQGGDRRPLDAQEREHRAQPRLHGGAGRRAAEPSGATRVAARPAADHLHRQPGRTDVGDDAHRVQRPPGRERRARRHRHHLREAGARERAARARRDQPARTGRARRCSTRRSHRCMSRATATPRSCARSSRWSGRRR